MDAAWWISVNGDQKGPFSSATLRQWFAEGKIPADALVRADNGPWTLARKVRLRKLDWHGLFGGLVIAAGVLLGVEVFWLMMTNPTAGRWTIGLFIAYVSAAMRMLRKK